MIEPLEHNLFDTYWNKEFEVSGRTPTDPADTLTTVPIDAVLKASVRSCPKGDCVFHHIVLSGGVPCRNCRYFVAGDYYSK